MVTKATGKPPGRPRKNTGVQEILDAEAAATEVENARIAEKGKVPPEWHNWPRVSDMAKELNLSRMRFAKQALAEGYTFKRFPDQSMRIHPDEAEECKLAVMQASQGDEAVVLNNVPELLSASAKLVETANEQSRELVKSLTEPLKEVASAQRAMLEDMRAILCERTERVKELESRQDELAKQRESMLNEQAERNMAETSFKAKELRKQQGWEQLMKVTPVLGQQVMGTISKWFNKGDPERAKKVAAAEAFLGSVTAEQAHMLMLAGFVQGEQRALLVSLFGEPPTPEKADEKGPPAAGT